MRRWYIQEYIDYRDQRKPRLNILGLPTLEFPTTPYPWSLPRSLHTQKCSSRSKMPHSSALRPLHSCTPLSHPCTSMFTFPAHGYRNTPVVLPPSVLCARPCPHGCRSVPLKSRTCCSPCWGQLKCVPRHLRRLLIKSKKDPPTTVKAKTRPTNIFSLSREKPGT